MEDVEIAVEIQNGNGVRSRRQTEVLVHVCPGIPAKLDTIIPDLHLAYRYRFTCVSNDVNCVHVNGFIPCGRYDLHPIDQRSTR
jgi:hypothetical protein